MGLDVRAAVEDDRSLARVEKDERADRHVRADLQVVPEEHEGIDAG